MHDGLRRVRQGAEVKVSREGGREGGSADNGEKGISNCTALKGLDCDFRKGEKIDGQRSYRASVYHDDDAVLMRLYGVLITCLASPKSTMQKAEEDLSRLTKLAGSCRM